LVSWPTPHWMFHSLAPSLILLPFPPTTLCSLCWWIWKCVGLSVDCCVEGLYSTWWFLIEFLRCSHWACTVVYVLYSWYCQALGVPQSLEATLQHYVVPVLSSTYCNRGAVTYWKFYSTMEATIQH
jgi:hypothetical protein